jgi:hypothetical protein
MIDVYLVPVGATRYEPYCEIPDAPDEPEPEEILPRGSWRRFRWRYFRMWFREMLAEAERERRQQHTTRPTTWAGRVKARTMRLVAESIAEQRLLWHLRKETSARLFYPDDLNEQAATSELRMQLKRDFDKHRFWMIIDGLLFITSGAFMLVPGPNILAYYFAFRLVGHYFSMRGARCGLAGVTWTMVASSPLTELRRAIGLQPDLRVRRVHEVAERLQLEHLVSFFERSAIPTQ